MPRTKKKQNKHNEDPNNRWHNSLLLRTDSIFNMDGFSMRHKTVHGRNLNYFFHSQGLHRGSP